jgi:PEP-CTERM motif
MRVSIPRVSIPRLSIPHLCRLALPLALALTTSLASATVLTFDDLGDDGDVPVHYGGLDWSGSSWFQYAGEQAPFAAHSGDRRATLGWDGSADTSAVRFQTASSFTGAWFAGYEGVSVTIDLYSGGTLVASTATLDLSASPVFLASSYSGLVDRLVFRSNDPANFVMDDLTFTAAVPEPSTAVLSLAGLGLVGFVARRRRQA